MQDLSAHRFLHSGKQCIVKLGFMLNKFQNDIEILNTNRGGDYYKELTKAKFGSKKAWHVTTRIGRRMFTEIAVPRNGVQMAFQAGQNAQITQKVAWSVFKSHDIMARYKRNAYKDDPTVASELVKFLAINTGIEAIDRVVTEVEVMEVEVTTTKREATRASRAASTASNKVDELKKVVDALAKRVGRLES